MSMSFEDLMNQAGGAFEKVPPITGAEFYVKSAKGGMTSNKKFRVEATCAIIGGPHDKKTVWNQFVLSPENPNALRFFFQHMAVLGLGVDWWKPRPMNEQTMQQAADAIVGKRFVADVSIKSVQNEDRNQLDKIRPSVVAPGQVYDGASLPGQTGVPAGITTPTPQVQVPTAPAPAPEPQLPLTENEQVTTAPKPPF